MARKVKKEALASPKAEAKARALKATKAVLKAIHMRPQEEKSLTTVPSSSGPLTTKSATKKIEDNSTLVFIVDIKADKHQIKQAVKKLYDPDVAKVNIPTRTEQEKKTYIQLAADYDALDVANKIAILETETS
ncbi:60S ribosomal protein L23a-like [Ailuropoda melanoleuca]|uniref:60S ribosomal protein L23a-like n=1 Tax=Ailuropoda melanoleuca TaxID=9646 RepID=UPI001494A64C|nr:60S ribosomal protein L23a-like [Ailuropoda melanoleuca]